MSRENISEGELPGVLGPEEQRTWRWFAGSPRAWLVPALIAEVILLGVLQAPYHRFDRFAFLDSGSELVVQDLIKRGLRPTVDFGYPYGLLPLLLSRVWYGLWGLSPGSFRLEVLACSICTAWGLARFAAYRRLRAAGLALIALTIPDLMLVTSITVVQVMEQALLVNALAEQARGRRRTALAIVTACCFVKPSLAFVQASALVAAILWDNRGKDWAACARSFLPALMTGGVLAALLGTTFGLLPLAGTLRPSTGMAIYRLNHLGFFRGVGREFWWFPNAQFRDYFRYELGYWLLGTALLAWGGLSALWRRVRGSSTSDTMLDDELIATCAVVHFAFVLFVFGHRMTWFYSLPMLVLGLATLAGRGARIRAVVWVLALLVLVSDRSKGLELVRRWRTEAPSTVTLGLWASTDERAEWSRVLELTREQKPVLLAMCDGAALLVPRFAPPVGAYFVLGNPLPSEIQRKADQLAAASVIVTTFANDWPGFAHWPALADAFRGCETVLEGRQLRVYRRTAPRPRP